MMSLFGPRPGRWGSAVALVLAAGFGEPLVAEDPALVSFQTGGGVLVSQEFPAVKDSGSSFHFQLGFDTAEAPVPGTFADSLTISLLGPATGQVLALATVDAFGLTPAPPNPGGLFLDLAAIRYETVPALVAPTNPRTFAFDVRVALPVEFTGQPLTVALDFFDNQNGLASKAYFAQPQTVPEPSTFALVAVGLAAVLARRNARRPW